jgi:glycerophosphoryl diester phosphodiesterase
MGYKKIITAIVLSFFVCVAMTGFAGAGMNQNKAQKLHNAIGWYKKWYKSIDEGKVAHLGPRPFYLIEDMEDSPLKKKLKRCTQKPVFFRSDFSIGHRGAALQFPEHTKESYEAAAAMGAGIIECDVTFTSDEKLVCRHSQCDLHTTTNILAIPELAAKCTTPFTPAVLDENGDVITPASARCCTSDITLEEFKMLKGKMDAYNPAATTVEEYMDATPAFRTDLYTQNGTLMTHAESIELFKKLGVKMTPELKSPSVDMPFNGDYTQEDYAQQMIDEYKAANVPPGKVYAQSFDYNDMLYWIENTPAYGKQAVYLDGRYGDPAFDYTDPDTWSPSMAEMVADGVKIIAPPMYMLLAVEDGKIVPSTYALEAKKAGLEIITWTLERSGLLESVEARNEFYYSSVKELIDNDGDMYEVLDVLAKDVGIIGIFADWPATVTFYANCMSQDLSSEDR